MLPAWTFSVATIFVLSVVWPASAGPKEDVAATTQAWIDALNSHDTERVVALYDSDALLWGTVSPTIRDTPAAIREYFKGLPNMPPEFKGSIGEQRVRIYGDIAINSGTYSFNNVRDGKPVTTAARFSFVYRNRDGRWLIVDHHSSAVPTPPQ
ncbi:MAG TPA: SgcJ/EcaC family oxidoreductase [Methylomirabilota bacterium]|jgi:uncharacterized protein (TIGR02246 family)